MAEKLFVISEIFGPFPKDYHEHKNHQLYRMADQVGELWLPDDAVIPASRLRYGPIEKEGQIFWGAWGGWVPAVKSTFARFPSIEQYLLLDPAPVDEWDRLVDQWLPNDSPERKRKVAFTLRRIADAQEKESK